MPRTPVLDKLTAVPKVLVGLLLLAVLAALLVTMRPAPATNELTAYFPRTVSLYPGSEVRILGVRVGEVEIGDPRGRAGQGHHELRAPVRRPRRRQSRHHLAGIVGDRFVQLTPAYTGGPTLRTTPSSSWTGPRHPSSWTRSTRASTTSSVAWARTGRTRKARSTTCSASRRATSTGTARSSTRPSRTSASSPGRWRTTRKSCSPPSPSSTASSGCWLDNDQTIRAFNDSGWPASPASWRASGRTSRSPSTTSDRDDGGVAVRARRTRAR